MGGLYYTPGLARQTLVASEGCLSPITGRAAHAGVKHVTAPNAFLMQRLAEEGRNNRIAWFSAFLSLDDAAAALTEVLNTDEVQRPLIQVFKGNQEQFSRNNVRTARTYRIRLAFANGVLTRETDRMDIVVHRSPAHERNILIYTFYARPPDFLQGG